MNISIALLVFFGALTATACSNRQLYQAMQSNRAQECPIEPQNLYEECLERLSTPYSEYERERRTLLED